MSDLIVGDKIQFIEETNEILVALQNMLWYLESGDLVGYKIEKKHYESLKEKDPSSASLSR